MSDVLMGLGGLYSIKEEGRARYIRKNIKS